LSGSLLLLLLNQILTRIAVGVILGLTLGHSVGHKVHVLLVIIRLSLVLVESSVEHRRLISWTSVLLPVARLAILLLIRETGLNRVLESQLCRIPLDQKDLHLHSAIHVSES